MGSFTLNSQAEVDDFIIQFPNCTELPNALRIEGADIVNLTGLSNLTILKSGLLMLNNSQLNNLVGLENVERIEGGISMLHSDLLTSLDGLNKLTYIGGQLQVESNLNLQDFSGLESLDTIAGQLFIYNNPAISDLSALENLRYIGGNLVITLSPLLSNCSIAPICDYAYNPNGAFVVSTNGAGCNNVQEIETNCNSCLVENIWQGPAGGSWHEVAHWSLSIVPTDCHHVIIPADSDLKILAGMEAFAYAITIEEGAIFETEAMGILNVVVGDN